MVLVHEDSKLRGFWKLAKVESLITATDGMTRGADVKVASSAGQPTVLRRPLQLLYTLEIHQCDGDEMPDTNDEQKATEPANDDATSPVAASKPRRRSNCVTSRNTRQFIHLQSEKFTDF